MDELIGKATGFATMIIHHLFDLHLQFDLHLLILISSINLFQECHLKVIYQARHSLHPNIITMDTVSHGP